MRDKSIVGVFTFAAVLNAESSTQSIYLAMAQTPANRALLLANSCFEIGAFLFLQSTGRDLNEHREGNDTVLINTMDSVRDQM